MHTLSREQQNIVSCVLKGDNILVDAVAGSGKTTTILAIASSVAPKNVIQITFNSQLKLDVREKIQEFNLKNINVYTYHSISTTFYDKFAYTDQKIIEILKQNKPIKIKRKEKEVQCDILIIDECQDMTKLYYQIVKKFIVDLDLLNQIQIVVMGDRNQGVYSFMAADTRFLIMAESVWQRPFTKLNLTESYRLTKQMAWFINNVMTGEQRIISKKNGVKVEYYLINPFVHTYLNDIIFKIKSESLKPEDVFILSASLKSTNSPAKMIENTFVQNGIPVYVPISDDAKIDDDVTRGKVVFSTFPSSKGRERKVVIVLGFDAGYFKYFAKNEPKHVCPPSLYVALTRAKERLILIGSNKEEYLPFMDMDHHDLKTYINVTGKNASSVGVRRRYNTVDSLENIRRTCPSDIVKFLKQETINKLTPIVEELCKTLQSPSIELNIKSKTKNKNYYEDVSDINGIAIPASWEAKHNGSGCTTIHNCLTASIENPKNTFFKKALASVKFPCITIDDYLYLANVYLAERDGYIGRIVQIKNYNWLDENDIKVCHNNLENIISKDELVFEENIGLDHGFSTPYGTIFINGYVDAMNSDELWELKCVDTVQIEHTLQLIVYAWLYKHKYNVIDKKFKLLNIRTNEIREINYDENKINTIMDILIHHKFSYDHKLSDTQFIDSLNTSTF